MEFSLHDPDNCIYYQDVIDFAVRKGYYNPKAGGPLRRPSSSSTAFRTAA